MLISIHLPKTAGSSLGTTLKEWFGNRLPLDYGDLIGDESAQSMTHRAKRKTAMLGKVSEISTAFDAIHGHFYAHKYFDALPSADFAVLMRDPFSRIPSYYDYLKRCHHHRNPLVVAIRKSEMSLDTFIRWDYMCNLCSRLLYPLNVEQLWFIGIQEHYGQSLQLLAAMLGRKAPDKLARVNTNPELGRYKLTADQHQSIQDNHGEDIDLYRRAQERFASLVSVYLPQNTPEVVE